MNIIHYFSKNKLSENNYLILGHLTFFALFILSFILANERVLYVDSVAQVFEFIRDEGFEIYDKRYTMYLFQALPVLAIKLHLPLPVVVYSYSFSMPVIGYLLWLITVYFLKDRKIGILMLFVILGIRQTFFHAISETFQLMFLASFLYAWLFQTRNELLCVFSKVLYYIIICIKAWKFGGERRRRCPICDCPIIRYAIVRFPIVRQPAFRKSDNRKSEI